MTATFTPTDTTGLHHRDGNRNLDGHPDNTEPDDHLQRQPRLSFEPGLLLRLPCPARAPAHRHRRLYGSEQQQIGSRERSPRALPPSPPGAFGRGLTPSLRSTPATRVTGRPPAARCRKGLSTSRLHLREAEPVSVAAGRPRYLPARHYAGRRIDDSRNHRIERRLDFRWIQKPYSPRLLLRLAQELPR